MVADAVNLPFPDQSFDAVVSFEVIEHVLDYHKYLSEVFRVLKRDGIFILSTPNRRVASPNGTLSNPDHCREFDPDEFKDVLAKQFTSVALYGHRPSNRAQKAEDSLKQVQERSAKAPGILKLVLPKKLKKAMFEMYMFFWAKRKTLPNPNGITEDDFVIEKDRTEDAVNLLAVCAK
jgi:ubiquinone/menaquinone biosynthesis C-methylase UbiE